MKARYFYFIAAALLFAGCNKEMVDADQIGGGKTVLEVGLPDSKTYMGDNEGGSRSVYWSNGDQIAVNGVASEELAELPAGTRSTTFTFDGVLNTPYKIIYPASIYKDATHVTLPAVQSYKAGGFADGMFPMAGYTTDGSDITLNHLCALVKISVLRASGDGADTDKIACVRFKGRNAERVSGTFEIDYPNTALVNDAGTGTGLEVRVVKSLATSTTTAVDYYLVVPAREYENGFDVIVQDVNGHIMTKSKTESKTFEAGHFYKMAAFEFVPTGTELGVEISNAEELIAFATAYNNQEYEPLGGNFLATVTDDIVFDPASSALYDATGGVGCVIDTETNYFNGVFDGGNHTISGLTATVPLFAYTGGAGTIKNLTLDSTCSFTVNTGSGSNHGVLVGRNKGDIFDCTSNASLVINNLQDITSAVQYYGGLVGYNPGGTIDGCTVTGDITCSQTDLTLTSSNSISLGGIVGYQSSDGGTINDCHFTGNITVSDDTTYGGISITYVNEKDETVGAYFYVGGILGYANKGVISGCTAGDSEATRTIDLRGTFVPEIGGILGWNSAAASSSVSGSTNYMTLKYASSGVRTATSPCRIAGIAARTAASVSECYNYGPVSTSCNSTTLTLGGIVGESAGANVSDCINYAGGTLTRSNADQTGAQANRYFVMGGIVGRLTSAAADVKACTNNAAILSNIPGTSTAMTMDIGGILGWADKQVDISGCENKGTLENNTGTTAVVFTRMTLGGILGYGPIANTTIFKCQNKAQVYCNAQQNKAGRSSQTGGIAGLMGTLAAGVAGLQIDSCSNAARVWNRNYNNTITPVASTPFGGGIVGAIVGTSASKASIHGCTTTSGDVVELRGYCGGLAGYAEAANLSGNTVGQAMTSSNANSQGAGGFVGWAVGTTISDCTSSANINQVKQIGGFVSYLDGTSSITGCKLNGATLTTGTNGAATAAAVLVSNAASGASITDCGVKGTLNGAAITLSSNMVTTDGGATVSGTYLLD